MQLKNLYTSLSVLGIAATMALTACGDDNSDTQFANNPGTGTENPVPGSSGSTELTSSSSIADITTESSSSAGTVDPSTLPAEGPITLPQGLGVLVDDFEDGDNKNKLDNYWYTYNDYGNGGASIITTPLNADGDITPATVNNGSTKALLVSYTLDRGDYEYEPYVGWGVQVDPDSTNDRFGGITYWYKGGAHEVHIEVTDVEDYDVHLAKVAASRTWKQAVIRFKDLVQGGWGKEVIFNAKNIRAISFQAKGNKNKAISDSLFIDNLYLQDTSEVEKDKPDMEIKDPVIPTVTFTDADIAVTNPLQEKAMKYLNKGVNFTNWLENADGKFKSFELGEKDVQILAENGFKSLRLPIDLDLYATNRDAFVKGTDAELKFDDDTLFMVLDSFVEWTAKHNMSFVIDYHEYDNSYNTTSAKDTNYIKMMAETWKHVAAHYAENTREDLFFELLNEPDMSDGKVTAAQWTTAAQAMIDAIRPSRSLPSVPRSPMTISSTSSTPTNRSPSRIRAVPGQTTPPFTIFRSPTIRQSGPQCRVISVSTRAQNLT